MAVNNSVDVAGMLREQLVSASPDLARHLLTSLTQALMSADVDGICGAGYGEVSPDRVNRRNGYRGRDWDTRVGTIELQIPKLREGTYFSGVVAGTAAAGRAGVDFGGGDQLPAGGVDPAGRESWWRPSGLKGSVSPRCRSWRKASMSRWRSGGAGRWTPGGTRSCGSMR